MKFTSVASGTLLAATATADAPTISAVGNKFFYENGTQFFLKGIAYQLSEDDPLVDTEQCQADAALMEELGANSIRVYHVDPSADHTGCMSAFADAGIYPLIDLDTFTTYILSPTQVTATWNQTQYDHFAAAMDAFADFDNVLGFFVGNEVIARADESLAAPYIRAAARDMKAYRDSKGYRKIPIGYSAADIAELRPMLQDYLTCGGDDSSTVDFFGLNSYEWCDPSTYSTSGYTTLETQAKNFPVPIFFSETGCNTPGPRLFEDQAAIFGENMVNDWSGAIIYEWIQEENNYGLVSYGASDGTAVVRSGTPSTVSPDFGNLKAQWATLSPTGVASSNYNTASVSTRDCPASTASGWLVDGNAALPNLGDVVTIHGSGAGQSSTVAATATATASSTASTSAVANASAATNSSGSGSNLVNRDVIMTGSAVAGIAILALWL